MEKKRYDVCKVSVTHAHAPQRRHPPASPLHISRPSPSCCAFIPLTASSGPIPPHRPQDPVVSLHSTRRRWIVRCLSMTPLIFWHEIQRSYWLVGQKEKVSSSSPAPHNYNHTHRDGRGSAQYGDREPRRFLCRQCSPHSPCLGILDPQSLFIFAGLASACIAIVYHSRPALLIFPSCRSLRL